MSRLYNYFVSCWKNGTVSEEGLRTAATKNLITQAECDSILLLDKNVI